MLRTHASVSKSELELLIAQITATSHGLRMVGCDHNRSHDDFGQLFLSEDSNGSNHLTWSLVPRRPSACDFAGFPSALYLP